MPHRRRLYVRNFNSSVTRRLRRLIQNINYYEAIANRRNYSRYRHITVQIVFIRILIDSYLLDPTPSLFNRLQNRWVTYRSEIRSILRSVQRSIQRSIQ